MVPQRPAVTGAGRKSGSIPFPGAPSFDTLKTRVLARLEDRLDPSASKRMPPALFRQSLRQQAEQLADQEGRGLPKADRERLVDQVLAELLGYGPLEELFNDPTVREVMVAGPHAVIVRREMESWMPANVRFRDEDHFRAALDRLATHADPVGGVTASVNLFDLKLPNGFRAVGVVPPPALGQPAIASFIRWEAGSSGITPPQPASGMYPPLPAASGSASAATGKPVPGSITTSPRPGSGLTGTPLSRTAMPAAVPAGETDPLSRHRKRIIERLITKLASLGVYDLQQVEITELRRIVAAYIAEYVATEKFYLSDTDQGRLMLEILTAMHR